MLITLLCVLANPVEILPRWTWDPVPRALPGVSQYDHPEREYRWIVVHHSSFIEPPGPDGIRRYHREVSGYADIGYHFVIDAEGKVLEGRSLLYMGAHAGESLEANRGVSRARHSGSQAAIDRARRLDPDWGAVGIVLDGYFDLGFLPSAAQIESLRGLLAELTRRYHIPKEHIVSHREVKERITEAQGRTHTGKITDCPGSGLQAVLEILRQTP